MLDSQPDLVAELLARLEALTPLIREMAPSFDQDRRLPDAVGHALADAGLFKLWLPKSFGGFELAPVDFMSVVEAATRLDASVGWIVGNIGGYARTAGYLPADAAKAIFSAERAAVVCSTANAGTAEHVKGGYRISGRWSFGSGIHHATSVALLCAIPDAASSPRMAMCYVDPRHVRVHDTWRTSGLRGTGSCDLEVAEAFVPQDYIHDLVEQSSYERSILYRVPNISMFNWTVATIPLGIADGVLRSFIAQAAGKIRAGHPAPLAEREVVQDKLGRLEAKRRAARAFMLDAMSDLMAAVDRGGDALVRARAAYRTAMSYAAETAVRIVDDVIAIQGAGAIFESSPFERAQRDVHAASKHIAMSPTLFTTAGRIMLGLPPLTPRF